MICASGKQNETDTSGSFSDAPFSSSASINRSFEFYFLAKVSKKEGRNNKPMESMSRVYVISTFGNVSLWLQSLKNNSLQVLPSFHE